MTAEESQRTIRLHDVAQRVVGLVQTHAARHVLGDETCKLIIRFMLVAVIAYHIAPRPSAATKTAAPNTNRERHSAAPRTWEGPDVHDARALLGVGPASTVAEIQDALMKRLVPSGTDTTRQKRLIKAGFLLILCANVEKAVRT